MKGGHTTNPLGEENVYSPQTDPFGNKFQLANEYDKNYIKHEYYKNANDDKDKTKYYKDEIDNKTGKNKFYYIKKSNWGLTKTKNYITELIRQDNQTPLPPTGGKRRTRRRSNKKRTNKRKKTKTRMKRRKTHKRKTNKRRRKR
jgi:hypothetical protein